MSVRLIRVRGKKVWQARVAFQGRRASTIRASKDEAREAETALLTKRYSSHPPSRRPSDW